MGTLVVVADKVVVDINFVEVDIDFVASGFVGFDFGFDVVGFACLVGLHFGIIGSCLDLFIWRFNAVDASLSKTWSFGASPLFVSFVYNSSYAFNVSLSLRFFKGLTNIAFES